MRRTLIGILFLLAAVPAARADDELDRLDAAYQKAQTKWFDKLPKSEDGGPVDTSNMPPHPAVKYLLKYRAYAEEHAGQPEAMRALISVVEMATHTSGQMTPGEGRPDANWAVRQLAKKHAADPDVTEHLNKLRRFTYFVASERLEKLYNVVVEKNSDREAKAAAKFGLAMLYRQGAYSLSGHTDQKDKAAVLLHELDKEFSDTQAGKSAAGYIFELEHLQIGMKAPDFEGKDADGKTIKLSQFRGQVVVVDFWGFW